MEIRIPSDLEKLIVNRATESVQLEFKSGEALNDLKSKEIAKDVSAFANSDGGIIIYGLGETRSEPGNKKSRGVASKIEPIVDSKISHEWLEQVIANNVQQRIQGIKIFPIVINEPTQGMVYVIEIPRSYFAPHMVIEDKFYKRGNFQSTPMLEYEIRDLYHRSNLTNLEIQELNPKMTPSTNQIETYVYEFPFYVNNVGVGYELHFKLLIETELEFEGMNNLVKDTYIVDNYRKMFKYVIPNDSPIFQNDEVKVINGKVTLSREKLREFSGGQIIVTLYYSSDSKVKKFPFKKFAKMVLLELM